MIRYARNMAAVLALLGALGGCESRTTIPAGAQQVHVDATGPIVRLDPTTVRAGDVYLVVDLPPQGGSLTMVGGVGGGLSDADLTRFTQAGDEQGTTTYGIDNSCCGNVHKQVLGVGKYAFVLQSDSLRPGVPPPTVAVLQVTA